MPDTDVLVEHSPCGLVVLNLGGEILFANHAFSSMVGQPDALLRQLHFQDLLPRGGKLFFETQFTPTLLLRTSVPTLPAVVSVMCVPPPGSVKKLGTSVPLEFFR